MRLLKFIRSCFARGRHNQTLFITQLYSEVIVFKSCEGWVLKLQDSQVLTSFPPLSYQWVGSPADGYYLQNDRLSKVVYLSKVTLVYGKILGLKELIKTN
jgi:hypothetical protein